MRKRSVAGLVLVLMVATSALASAETQGRAGEIAREIRGEGTEFVLENAGIDALEKLDHERPFAAVTSGSEPEHKTLYLHSATPVGLVDEANEFTGGSGGPFMDETAPSDPLPHLASWTPVANHGFRKNILAAYWGGAVSGTIVGDLTVRLWLASPLDDHVEVSLFGDGGLGVATPIAQKTVAVAAGSPQVDVTFTGLNAIVRQELVLQVIGGVVGGDAVGGILYDATAFPSGLSFDLGPIVERIALDDPAGIAFRGSDVVVANSGTGDLVTVADGAVDTVLASGFPDGGFTRGIAGVAVDGDGIVYASIVDTGEIIFVRPDGTGGMFARGLGAPIGLAFGTDGDLYVAESDHPRITRFAPDGSREVVTEELPGHPYGIAARADGMLVIATNDGSGLLLVDPSDGTQTDLVEASGQRYEGIAIGESGAIYVADGRAGTITRIVGGDLEIVASDLAGPTNLAFRPGATELLAAVQGPDAVVTIDVGEEGLSLNAPSVSPVALAPQAPVWVYRSGARALDPATVAGPLPRADFRSIDHPAFEPTVGVQSDGDVFMVAGQFDQAGGVLGSPEIFRSRDGGVSWDNVTPKDLLTGTEDAPVVTLDPFLYVDPATDRVFTFDLSAACHYLSYSDDDGDTWTTNPLACGVPPVDHQSLIAGPSRTIGTSGYPNVLYHCSNWVAGSPCGRSFDGGSTWVPGGVAYVSVTDLNHPGERRNCSSLTGHLATDPDGRVFLPRGHCGRPYVSISEDDGLTWDNVEVAGLPSNQHETAVASDAAGNLYYLFISADRLPYLVISRDHGRTWSDPRMVAPPGVVEANLPSIAAGDEGSVALLYYGTPNDYGYAARQYPKVAWNAYVTVTTDALAADPIFMTTTGNPLTDPMVRGTCGPDRCGNVFDFLKVVVAPDGRVWASATDTCVTACVTDRGAGSTAADGGVIPLIAGPRLRGGGSLSPI